MQHLKSYNHFSKIFESSVFQNLKNDHSRLIAKLINQGYNIQFKFVDSVERESQYVQYKSPVQYIYDQCSDIIFPILSNAVVKTKNSKGKSETIFADVKSELEKILNNKDRLYYVNPLSTHGRYDVDSSITYNMTNSEIEKAKSIYKGKKNFEYSFAFRDGKQIAIIVSKSGKFSTIASEDDDVHIPSLFVKMPKWKTFHLKEGWVDADRLIEILKKLDSKVAPIYKSEKLNDLDSKTGIFEKTLQNPFIEIEGSVRKDTFIVEGHLDKDSYITYGIYRDGDKKGQEFMEYYKGSNYKSGSSAKNFSRFYYKENIPAKWLPFWQSLKELAMQKYPIYFSDKLTSFDNTTGVFDIN